MAHRNRTRKGLALDGILLVDKPPEWTSHDVVGFVRGRYRLAKVGHGGTLDPMATGLLVLLLGKGTKCSDAVMAGEKVYEGELTLGTTTDSQDREGEVLETRPLPPDLSREAVEALLPEFTGDILQIPPMVSALKKDGVPLYKLARAGKTIEREARPVTIHQLELLGWTPPVVGLRVRCSKGTYVRTLAHDLGEKIGCGAHLSALRRTASGNFSVEDAVTVDALREMDLEAMTARLHPLLET
jgi:tRNA pseudouridine55 synthase